MAAKPPNIPQYDLPQREIELLKQQAVVRAQKRNQFLKMTTSPFRGEGYLFDPAIQKYIALKANQYDYFQMTPKTSLWGIGVVVIPCLIFGYLVHNERRIKEEAFRTGKVAYKDRLFKFV